MLLGRVIDLGVELAMIFYGRLAYEPKSPTFLKGSKIVNFVGIYHCLLPKV